MQLTRTWRRQHSITASKTRRWMNKVLVFSWRYSRHNRLALMQPRFFPLLQKDELLCISLTKNRPGNNQWTRLSACARQWRHEQWSPTILAKFKQEATSDNRMANQRNSDSLNNIILNNSHCMTSHYNILSATSGAFKSLSITWNTFVTINIDGRTSMRIPINTSSQTKHQAATESQASTSQLHSQLHKPIQNMNISHNNN